MSQAEWERRRACGSSSLGPPEGSGVHLRGAHRGWGPCHRFGSNGPGSSARRALGRHGRRGTWQRRRGHPRSYCGPRGTRCVGPRASRDRDGAVPRDRRGRVAAGALREPRRTVPRRPSRCGPLGGAGIGRLVDVRHIAACTTSTCGKGPLTWLQKLASRRWCARWHSSSRSSGSG